MKKLITISFLLGISSLAMAESSSFGGAYIGGELGSTKQKFSVAGSELGYNTDADYVGTGSRALGVGVFGGYAFDYGANFVGIVEGKFRLSNNKTKDEFGEQISKEQFRLGAYYLQGYQIENFLPYVKVGVELAAFKMNDTSTVAHHGYSFENAGAIGFSYGLGVKYKVSQNLSVGIDYSKSDLRANLESSNIKFKDDTFALNASYHF